MADEVVNAEQTSLENQQQVIPEESKSLIAEVFSERKNSVLPEPITDNLANAEEKAVESVPESKEVSAEIKNEDKNPDKNNPENAGNPADNSKKILDELEKLRKQTEIAEKRTRDTQANWQKEHQLRLEYEKQMAINTEKAKYESSRKKESGDKLFADEQIDSDSLTPDKIDEIVNRRIQKLEQEKVRPLEQEIARQRQEKAIFEWENAAKPVKEKNSDFDDVANFLADKVESDNSVKEKWLNSEQTPEAAYKLGRELKDREEFLKNPEELIAKKVQEALNNQRNTISTEKPAEIKPPESNREKPDLSRLNPNSSSVLETEQNYDNSGSLVYSVLSRRKQRK